MPDNALGLILLSLPLDYSDFVIEWLLKDNLKRFHLGLGCQRPQWMLAADLIKRFSDSCSENNLRELEKVLYSFNPVGEDFRRAYKYRLEANRAGWYFPAWGEAQYFLLPSLPADKISINTKNLISELNRKFSKYPTSRFYSSSEMNGGYIGSKLEPNIDKISNNAWIKIITDQKTPKHHDHSSWKQVAEDSVHVSSHEMFSRSLEKAAKADPDRFCGLFQNLLFDIDDSYVSSMLSAFALSEPEASNENNNSWKKIDMKSIEQFWIKFRDKRFENNIARSYCWMIKARSEDAWPFWMIKDLVELATNHQDPAEDKILVVSNGETLETASPHSLYSTTINSVRGSAVEAIGAILWRDKDLFVNIETDLNELLLDKHPAVLMGIASIATPILNIDKEKAIDFFDKACSRDIRVSCSRESINFFNYTIASKDGRLLDIIRKMVVSEIAEVVEISAEMIAFYSQCYEGILGPELKEITEGTIIQRRGVVQAVNNLIRKNNHTEEAKEIIKLYFNDPDKEVRKASARLFSNEDILNVSENVELALSFVDSLAFLDNELNLLRCLERYKGDLLIFQNLILTACSKSLDSFKNKKKDYSMRFEMKTVVTLLIRLYEQAARDESLRDRCLNVWDKFFEENVGMTRELTNILSK